MIDVSGASILSTKFTARILLFLNVIRNRFTLYTPQYLGLRPKFNYI